MDFTANNQMAVGTLTASRYNSADCLRLLLQAGWPVDDSTVLLAARSGYAECFEPMIEHKVCCLTARVIEAAAVAGQLHLIEYLYFYAPAVCVTCSYTATSTTTQCCQASV